MSLMKQYAANRTTRSASTPTLSAVKVRLDSQGYDKYNRYFGVTDVPVYRLWLADEDFSAYVRAADSAAAKVRGLELLADRNASRSR